MMGAAVPGGGVPWTPAEKQFMVDNPSMSTAEVSKRLGKTAHAVNHMRREMGLSRRIQKKKWSDSEDDYVREARKNGKSVAEMARNLGRNTNMVNCRLKKLGLTTPLSEIRLSNEHKQFIKDHPDMLGVKLSQRIGFRPTTLLRHRKELGLRPLLDRSNWTDDETELLRKNINKKLSEIYALFPHRSHSSVSGKAQSLGRRRRNNKGFSINKQGYKFVYDNGKCVLEHQKIMEENMGRKILHGEVIHHINRDREDNRLENLVLFGSHREHMKAEYSYLRLIPKLLERQIISYNRSKHEYCIDRSVKHYRQCTLPH